jgi:asparagine synthetase B (glutamine-hydrolysing)
MLIILEKRESWAGVEITAADGPPRDRHDGGGIEVAVVGYPYDRIRVEWLTAGDIHRRYLENGAAFTDDLEGSYAVLILDRNRRRCFVIIDPYKIFTLFHAALPDGSLIISDSIPEIARHLRDKRINKTAALEFFNFGFMLGNKTLLEGVSTFGPGRIYTIDDGLAIGEESYWSFLGGEGDTKPNELIDAFDKHVANGLRLSDRISMPLTAGLDSRTVLSACMGARERLHCYTHGQRSSDDVRIARKIARRFGIKHDYYEIGEDTIPNIPSIARSMSFSCNGLINTVTTAHFPASFERESEKGDMFFSGIGGELLRSYYMPSGAERLDTLGAFAGAIRRKIQFGADNGIYRGMGTGDVQDTLDRSVQAELSGYSTDDPHALSERFYLENRIGNFLALSMRLLGRYFKTFNPFLEREMLRLIPRLPAADKAGGGLQTRIILHNAPGLARILMDRARIVDSSDSTALMKHLALRPFVLAKIYANKLTGRSLFNFSFTDYDRWLKHYHRDFVMETLDHDHMRLAPLFDGAGLENLANRFLDTRSNLLGFVTNIMSAEIFLRELR